MNFAGHIDALIDHFGILRSEIELPTPDDYPDEFMVMGKHTEIVTTKVAFNNAKEMLNDGEDIFEFITDKTIDYYTRLGNSEYFFRFF
tara:strand:- start:37998 stop:38261 length:264 start_codon:yes stop_codon:yes gene_type:complete